MKKLIAFLLFITPLFLFAQDKVGINTTSPNFKLDIRGLDDEADGSDLQLATPSENHFLRLFGGRGGDPRPFLLFSNNDTFRIVTSGSDYSNFTERMSILPDGKIGFNNLNGRAQDIKERFQVFADQNYYITEEDQSSPPGSKDFLISTPTAAAQQFTVGKTGKLLGFTLEMRSLGANNSKLSFYLKEGDESGTTLSSGIFIITSSSYGDVEVLLDFPIDVYEGDLLFLEVQHDADDFAEWNGDDTDPYLEGEGFVYNGGWINLSGEDMSFATKMDVAYSSREPILSVLDGEGRVQVNNYKLPLNDGFYQQVMTTNGSGDLSWAYQIGGGAFTNVSGTVQNAGNLTTDDFVFGASSLGAFSQNHFYFDKTLGAFRSGRANSVDWMTPNVGQFSFSSGWNTRASGYASQAFGQQTQAQGDHSSVFGLSSLAFGQYGFASGNASNAHGESSVAMGDHNSAIGDNATALGSNNSAKRLSATAIGQDNTADAFASSAFGYGNIVNGSSSTAVGLWNDPVVAPNSSIESNTPLFTVGNGFNNSIRTNAMVVRYDGRVGIGTNTPASLIHAASPGEARIQIQGEEGDAVLQLTSSSNISNDDWTIRKAVSSGDMLDWRYDGTSRMQMKPDGSLAIGTGTFATDYQVSIGGKLIAEEVRVQVLGLWPDYVFTEEYELMPLDQLEKTIKQNQHLPGIPSAQEIMDEGLHLGAMQKAMMEKIEELTLYVIELNKQNKEFENKIEALSKSQTNHEK